MLTPPRGWKMAANGNLYPVSPADWYMFAVKPSALQILALMSKMPGAALKLVDRSSSFYFLPPAMNAVNSGVWVVEGTVPADDGSALQVSEFAGDLYDRGQPSPPFGGKLSEADHPVDDHEPTGGPNLIYRNDGSGVAEFFWSVETAPVLKP